jgi:hypothetical protein
MSATNGSVHGSMASVKRPWRTPRLPRVVGIKGACALLGVHKTTLNHWMEPGSGTLGPDKTYMIPPRRVGDGSDEDDGWPIWDRDDVVRFAVEIGRQRAPVGQAKPRRQRSRDPEALREQIAALEKQLRAVEAKPS